MKVLFSTGSLFYLPTKDIFYLSRETGFDGCELVIDRRFNDMRYVDEVIECLSVLPVCSIHAPYHRMKSWGTVAEALVRTIEIAKSMGVEVVNFHPPSWYSMELRFFNWFRKIRDFQKDFGCENVFLAIENMPLIGKRLMLAPYVLNDFEDMIRFGMERNLYFTFDTTHLGTFGKDVIGGFFKFLQTGRLKNIHLSDYENTKSHLFLGRGELPIVKLLNTARRLGYGGMITIELSPHELPRTREWLVRMMSYQRNFVKLHTGNTLND